MKIAYYTLHFEMSAEEALERIEIVFEGNLVPEDGSDNTKEGFDTVIFHEFNGLDERFPEYSNFIIEPISELNDEEYRNLSITLSHMLDAKLGNTAVFMGDVEAEPVSVKLSDKSTDKKERTLIDDKWLHNYYLKAKSIVKSGPERITINDKTSDNVKSMLVALSGALIQSYENDVTGYVVARVFETGEGSVGLPYRSVYATEITRIITDNYESKSPIEILFVSSLEMYPEERPERMLDTLEEFKEYLNKYKK